MLVLILSIHFGIVCVVFYICNFYSWIRTQRKIKVWDENHSTSTRLTKTQKIKWDIDTVDNRRKMKYALYYKTLSRHNKKQFV